MIAGSTLAIDASCWLHEFGAVFVVNIVRKRDTSDLLRSWEVRVTQMIKHRVTPIFCFDGMRNPGKQTTDASRDQKRQEAKKQVRDIIICLGV